VTRASCVPPGGGTLIRLGDFQAAAGRGGAAGNDQGSVGPCHLRHAHLGAHRGGLRDPEEAQPAGRPGGEQTLVTANGSAASVFQAHCILVEREKTRNRTTSVPDRTTYTGAPVEQRRPGTELVLYRDRTTSPGGYQTLVN